MLGWSPGSVFLLFPAWGYVMGGELLGVVRHMLGDHVVTTAMMPVVVLILAKTIIEVTAVLGVFVGPRLVQKMFDL